MKFIELVDYIKEHSKITEEINLYQLYDNFYNIFSTNCCNYRI